jgi:hypothetical protein
VGLVMTRDPHCDREPPSPQGRRRGTAGGRREIRGRHRGPGDRSQVSTGRACRRRVRTGALRYALDYLDELGMDWRAFELLPHTVPGGEVEVEELQVSA